MDETREQEVEYENIEFDRYVRWCEEQREFLEKRLREGRSRVAQERADKALMAELDRKARKALDDAFKDLERGVTRGGKIIIEL